MYPFILFSVIVCIAVFIHRRRWQGFAILGLAVGAVTGVGFLTLQLDNRIPALIAFGFALSLFLIGLYIALLSRRPIVHERCPRCRYDLRGNTSGLCPECGTASPISRAMPAPASAPITAHERAPHRPGDARRRYFASVSARQHTAPAQREVSEVQPEHDHRADRPHADDPHPVPAG